VGRRPSVNAGGTWQVPSLETMVPGGGVANGMVVRGKDNVRDGSGV